MLFQVSEMQENGSVRYAVKWSYKISYTTDEKCVNIVRVFHTSQSSEKINL